jgi:hypothetical protein
MSIFGRLFDHALCHARPLRGANFRRDGNHLFEGMLE